MAKISKEGKRFRDFYEIGSVHIPKIVEILKKIQDLRKKYNVTFKELQELFNNEMYFIGVCSTIQSSGFYIGKGSSMYMCWNRDISLISSKLDPVNGIVKNKSNNKNYIQYIPDDEGVFTEAQFRAVPIGLPEGLDVMKLPEESLFQTILCVQADLLDGAAALMGLQASGLQEEIIYFGESLLKMQRVYEATNVVYNKLRQKYVN